MAQKITPRKDLYIYHLPYKDYFIHSWLDKIELSFSAITNLIIPFNKWNVWQKEIFIGGIAYPCIYQVSVTKWYKMSIDIVYMFDWQKVELIKIFLEAKSPLASFKNKVVIEWRFLRFTKIDRFQFKVKDILDFLAQHFTELKLLQYDYCMDLEIPKEYNDFLGTLASELMYIDPKRVIDEAKNSWKINTVYDWDRSLKNNDTLAGTYYNKTFQIRNENIQYLYQSYLERKNPIMRFELEFRRMSVKNISFQQLYDSTFLFDLFITKLESRVPIFKKIFKHKKELLKRKDEKTMTHLPWWDMYKIDMMNKENHIRSIAIQYSRFEKQWIDMSKIKENIQNLQISKAIEYKVYYIGMLNGISEFFLWADEVLYINFKKEIEGHIKVIEATCGIPYSEFLVYVDGYISSNIHTMARQLPRPIICLIDAYFVEKVFPEDDKVFEFLKIFGKVGAIKFSEPEIRKAIRQIKKTASYKFLYNQRKDNDTDIACKIVQFISNHI